MEKDFDSWNSLKIKLDSEHKNPTFKEGEIWWCNLGLNIGHEENGKGKQFSRPVLILRKFNKHLFLCVPLTTKIKNKSYYHKINLKGEPRCIIVSQIRLLSSNRLSDKIEEISESGFKEVKESVKRIIRL